MLAASAVVSTSKVIDSTKALPSRQNNCDHGSILSPNSVDTGHAWSGLQETPEKPDPSHSTENRQKLKSNKPKSRPKNHARSASSIMRSNALDVALVAYLKTSSISSVIKFMTAAQPYAPGSKAAAALVDVVTASAPVAIRADAAIEAMVRLKHSFRVRTSAPLLAAVARAAKNDPVVEMRSKRALSIFRALLRDRLMPTPELVHACFDACVAAVDIISALSFMEVARSSGYFELNASPPIGPSAQLAAAHVPIASKERDIGFGGTPTEIAYYDGIVQAAVFSGSYEVAATALREMSSRGLDGHTSTLGILVALYSELGRTDLAGSAYHTIRSQGEVPCPAAYAALIRAEGLRGNSRAAFDLFEEFENNLRNVNNLRETLSTIVTTSAESGTASSAALAASKGDVVLSMFQALRSARDADGAINFLNHMQHRYKFEVNRIVWTLLFETFCRAVPQRLDLARYVRSKISTTKFAMPESVVVKR